ncbi:hypothetical protein CBM2610_U10068 [Cupriavidus taiwanensis]|nr:hypothetical protein CBM2610_U10068 [Cupriavidus taiwanensis]
MFWRCTTVIVAAARSVTRESPYVDASRIASRLTWWSTGEGSTPMSGPFVQAAQPAGPYGIRWRGPHLIIERCCSHSLSGFPRPGPTC